MISNRFHRATIWECTLAADEKQRNRDIGMLGMRPRGAQVAAGGLGQEGGRERAPIAFLEKIGSATFRDEHWLLECRLRLSATRPHATEWIHRGI